MGFRNKETACSVVGQPNWQKGRSADFIADMTGIDIDFVKEIIEQLKKEN